MSVKPVAEVSVLPMPDDPAAMGSLMSAARVEAHAGALVWPQMCCCCGSTTDLDSIRIYSRGRFGGRSAAIHIPYCSRCKSHHRPAGQRAAESVAAVLVIGFTILLVPFLFGMLNDQFIAFFLQLVLVFGSVVWGGRTYFVARARIKNGITPACSGAETAAVIFVTAESSAWRFRFCSRAYAEHFAAVNPGGYLTPLYAPEGHRSNTGASHGETRTTNPAVDEGVNQETEGGREGQVR